MKQLLISAIVLLAGCHAKQNEETVTLTRNEFMVIYQNGYLKGQQSAIDHVLNGASLDTWQADSLSIDHRFNLMSIK